MRKKFYMVLDVETANSLDDPLTYDIGFLVMDKQGKVYESASFLIKEVWDCKEWMQSAYYAAKIPRYLKEWARGKFNKVSLYDARQAIKNAITKYSIEDVYAYNANFDRNALNTTQRYTTSSKYRWFLPYGVQIKCIWHMACQTLCTRKGYRAFCRDNGFVSAAGNYKTSAEVVYAYMKSMPNYEEKHTGLEDCKIEAEILAYILRQKKGINRNIYRQCWRIPQTKLA